jgi:signal transduction histidine kinase
MSTQKTRIQELTAALEQEKQARQQVEAELKTMQHSQQEYISLVAHELRIPMTAIQGYTDLLIKAIMGPVNDTQLTFLKTIRSNVERMSRLVGDLSDINKIMSNQLVLKPRAVPLNSLIDELETDFETMTSDKIQTLNINIPAESIQVWGDADRLHQVLSNVLRNAVQYTPNGGKISIIAAKDSANTQHVKVEISDSGIGIPANQQDRIFEMFFRSADDETRQTSGNGLALHLSQKLMELQDGSITFESSRGKGSTFTITIPIAPPQ